MSTTSATPLREQDPDNAAIYAANAEAYKAEIARHDRAAARRASPRSREDQRWLVTCEGAFSYLARDFGLKELYLWPMNADQVGTPQQVRSVIDGVRDQRHPGRLLRKHGQHRPGRAGRARDRGRVSAVCSMSISLSDGGRAGADLSRPAARHLRDRRRRAAGR